MIQEVKIYTLICDKCGKISDGLITKEAARQQKNWLQYEDKDYCLECSDQTIALYESGLKFIHTTLGQAAFIPKDTVGNVATKILFPDYWSIAQLRAMADYMEAYPNCTIYSDGSGEPCK